jgi:hypothetical protein
MARRASRASADDRRLAFGEAVEVTHALTLAELTGPIQAGLMVVSR